MYMLHPGPGRTGSGIEGKMGRIGGNSFSIMSLESPDPDVFYIAIMGASGSGKTTLMHILAGKSQGQTVVEGQVRVNGMPAKRIQHFSEFVNQHDIFVETLTTWEHLHFMAQMKLGGGMTAREIEGLLQSITSELSLSHCKHTRIGSFGEGGTQGLSGGERKRLAFATEILTDPQLLFCDEPTTGLDSFSAQKVVETLKGLAIRGKTIISTIHQPTSHTFALFDEILLLAEGRIIYLGKRCEAPGFFRALNHPCPEEYNPADFYMKVLAIYPGQEEECKRRVTDISRAFTSSKECEVLKRSMEEELLRSVDKDPGTFVTRLGKHGPSWITQLRWLTWRAGLNSYRDPAIHRIRTIQKIIVALILGLCYFGVTLNQMGIQDVQGAMFVFISESTFPCLYGVLNVFPSQIPLFLREHQAGLYPTGVYYLSIVISLLTGFIFEPLLFSSIAYWMVGLRPTATAFFTTCAIVILTANVSAACGCFFSAVFEDITVAITCLLPVDYLLKVAGGLFINIKSMPSYLSWTNYLSWFLYANEAVTVTQWTGMSNISCEGTPPILCITEGEDVIRSRSFTPDGVHLDFLGMIILYFVFHIAGYLAIVMRSRQK